MFPSQDLLDWQEVESYREMDELRLSADRIEYNRIRDNAGDTIGWVFAYLVNGIWTLFQIMDRNGDVGATMRRAVWKPERRR